MYYKTMKSGALGIETTIKLKVYSEVKVSQIISLKKQVKN